MSTAGNEPNQPRDSIGKLPLEKPRPHPLLWPALGLIAGIWLSEQVGPTSGAARLVVFATPLVLLAILLSHVRRSVLAIGLAAVLALAVGFARHQDATSRPPNHIANVLGADSLLTRLAGRIVTTPVERPSIRRNMFLVFDPPARTQFVLAVEELRAADPPATAVGTLRVSVAATELGLRPGQRVELTGRLYSPRGPRNPGERDWSLWYRHQGIDAGLAVDGAAHVVPLAGVRSWYCAATDWLRGRVQGLLFEPFADHAADESVRLLDVMVLGQRSAADRDLNEAFLRAGGMHFLAVSGFHVGVLAVVSWWLPRRVFNRRRRTAALVMLLATVLYAIVAEPNAPVLRATIMVVLAGIAIMANRGLNPINWLALSSICLLMVSPLELFRAGFQLSFVMVLALVLLVPRVPFLWRRRLDPLSPDDKLSHEAQTWTELVWFQLRSWGGGLVVVCAVAWVISLPLVMLHFGRFAPWGWLGSMVLSPLVIATVVLGFATILVGVVPALFGISLPLLGIPLRLVTHALLAVVGLFEHFPAAVVECQPPPVGLVLVTYGGLLALALRRAWAARVTERDRVERPAVTGPLAHARGSVPRRPTWGSATPATVVAGAGAILLILAWVGWALVPTGGDGYDVHVLAVGNGSATVITTPRRRGVVCDSGTIANFDAGQTAARALRSLGVRRVERVLISHANFDHYSGLPTLLRTISVAEWSSNPYFVERGTREGPVGRLIDELPVGSCEPGVLRAGDRFPLDEATFEVLWPPDDLDESWPANDRSLVVRFAVGGRSVLLTGDIEDAALAALLAERRAGRVDLAADVLVAPHHGAVVDETAAFYRAVAPRVVVVSTATPRPKLRAMVADTLGPDCRVVMTGAAGAITIHMSADDDSLIETPLGG